ncbi:hypothetical protein [Nocardia salmonicida]
MMKKLAIPALLVAAMATTVGTAGAAPDRPTGVNFTAATTDTSTVITTDAGSMGIDGDLFTIKAADGRTLAGTPLSVRVDEFVFPIAAEISGRTATLVPQFDLAHAAYKPVAMPFENQAPWRTEYEREQAAWSRLTTTITMGAAVGTTIGGLSGAAVGCVLGGIAGAAVASAAIVGLFGGFLPAAAVGCLGGIVAVGALGTLAGQLLVTGPAVIGAMVQYFTTINSPLRPVPAK